MKGYSLEIPENCASARLEGVNASYKDLAEVCGRIRNRKAAWAVSFLEKAAEGEVAVLYKRHNRNLGHRRELGGRKGRYPEKAARIVLKLLQSAMANGKVLGLGEEYTILAVSATKKDIFPRLSPKGRRMRMSLQTSRVEIVLKGSEVPKGVSVTLPQKKAEAKKEEKKAEAKPAEKPAAKTETAKPETKKEEAPVLGKEQKPEPGILKEEAKAHEHKHEAEKTQEQEKKRPATPHQHGENNKR